MLHHDEAQAYDLSNLGMQFLRQADQPWVQSLPVVRCVVTTRIPNCFGYPAWMYWVKRYLKSPGVAEQIVADQKWWENTLTQAAAS